MTRGAARGRDGPLGRGWRAFPETGANPGTGSAAQTAILEWVGRLPVVGTLDGRADGVVITRGEASGLCSSMRSP